MRVELTNGADGGPLFRLIAEPGNAQDAVFLAEFPLTTTVNLAAKVERQGTALYVYEVGDE